MQLRICGSRGSLPSPGAAMLRYGGNTSCVQLKLSDGTQVVLDAGSGMRNVPLTPDDIERPLHILLTHLHLDHIQGLLFFAPLFRAEADITIWGPSAPGVSLRDRIARYLSAPLTPVEIRELPCRLDFRNCPVSEWTIGSARIRAEAVSHRGPTLGFRIEDDGTSLCYLPDHEPALIGEIDSLADDWLSGFSLAQGADLLLHDCQYSDAEYPTHFGWGHSAMSHAVQFAHRAEVAAAMLFHHDPYHTDEQLDAIYSDALEQWQHLGRERDSLRMAVEEMVLTV